MASFIHIKCSQTLHMQGIKLLFSPKDEEETVKVGGEQTPGSLMPYLLAAYLTSYGSGDI